MRRSIPSLALLAAALLAGCGSSSRHASTTTTTTAHTSSSTSTTADYNPPVDPTSFSNHVTNRYFPLKPGTTLLLQGTRDGKPQQTEMVVTSETRTILGVSCVVVRDTVTSNGALVEKTTDWYAQAANGDVWYFGEDTKEYTNGVVSSTHGTWEAGVDNARPGIVMKAEPRIGDSYRQEYRPGEAEDMAAVLRIDASGQAPAGTYRDVLVTKDTDPLNPDKVDEKHYAPGVGLIYSKRISSTHSEESSLVKVTSG